MNKKEIYNRIMESVAVKVKKALNESREDGWNKDDLDELTEILNEIQGLQYEINNCVKGAYTNCETYNELGKYIINLGEDLIAAGENIMRLPDPIEEDEDEFEY